MNTTKEKLETLESYINNNLIKNAKFMLKAPSIKKQIKKVCEIFINGEKNTNPTKSKGAWLCGPLGSGKRYLVTTAIKYLFDKTEFEKHICLDMEKYCDINSFFDDLIQTLEKYKKGIIFLEDIEKTNTTIKTSIKNMIERNKLEYNNKVFSLQKYYIFITENTPCHEKTKQ